MIPGPVLRHELRATARRREVYGLRIVLSLVFGAIAIVPGMMVLGEKAFDNDIFSIQALRGFGSTTLIALVVVQLVASALVVPGLVGGAFAEERDRDTLAALLLTRLTHGQIVLAKLVGRLPLAVSPVLAGLPLVVAAAWAAGMPFTVVVLTAAATAGTVGAMAALAIFASARYVSSSQARSMALLLAWVWLILFPVGSVFPIVWVPGWTSLAAGLRDVCAVIAPSSPLSLVTDSSWIGDRTGDELSRRLLLMLGMQAALATLAVLGAAMSLEVREPRPARATFPDPLRGYRPSCGDDPIVWREFDLPTRRGSRPKMLVWLLYLVYLIRYFLALIRVQLIVVVRIIGAALAVALPAAFLVATVWFGYPAYVELWQHGYTAVDQFQARTNFNICVRVISAILALPSLLGLCALSAARITTERDKKTWSVLLTTPLTGAEILGGKMRALVRTLLPAVRRLGPLWIVGVACGSIHPLGLIVAVVDLPLAAWAGIALGTWIALRRESTSAASSAAAIASLGLVTLHGPLLLVALSSLRDVGEFLAWDLGLRGLVILTMVVVPLATGLLALSLTRRVFLKFDEWVGRPLRVATSEDVPKKKLDVKAERDVPVGVGA